MTIKNPPLKELEEEVFLFFFDGKKKISMKIKISPLIEVEEEFFVFVFFDRKKKKISLKIRSPPSKK